MKQIHNHISAFNTYVGRAKIKGSFIINSDKTVTQ
jgi:hypothetical protein